MAILFLTSYGQLLVEEIGAREKDMAEEPGATSRYYCHMCSVIVRPELGVEEVKCPHCRSGFVEEMADGRRSSNAVGDRGTTATGAGPDDAGARSELAVPPWPPILMDLLGVPYGLDGGDVAALARRQYRHLAFLQLLNALQEGDADADGDAPDLGLERLVLVSPADAHAMLMPERGASNGAAAARGPGLTLGELILGPGLDLLLEYLAETDPSRQGTLPAKMEAVAALPTVKVSEAATCPVCLDEFTAGGEAKEMPCKHRFHDVCILPWLEAHSSCPVCRYQLPTDETTEPPGNGTEETADESSGNARRDVEGDSDGGSSVRRRWLARPFGRFFSRRSNGSSSSSR